MAFFLNISNINFFYCILFIRFYLKNILIVVCFIFYNLHKSFLQTQLEPSTEYIKFNRNIIELNSYQKQYAEIIYEVLSNYYKDAISAFYKSSKKL